MRAAEGEQDLWEESVPTLNRRLRDLRQIASSLKRSRITPLQLCEAILERRLVNREARRFLSGLPHDEKHYWVASLYALLMPDALRRRLAAYFTPPHLAQYAIDTVVEAGVAPGRDRILDPASGGAAFLVPLAARIVAQGRQRGQSNPIIIRSINDTLRGIEIDSGLAKLTRVLLADFLNSETMSSGITLGGLVECANTLELEPPGSLYDAVIGNPPYGRILQPSPKLLERYRPVISEGYVNLYALFIEQALQWVRPGGVVCLIVPTSFVGGPYFAALRKCILENASVLRLDLVDKRKDVFLDVLYDLCVILLRRNEGHARLVIAKSSRLLIDRTHCDLGSLELPTQPSGHVWALPDAEADEPLFQPGLATLGDYGYLAKTGYFVWNREKHRYRIGRRPRSTEVPLVWAHNVRANEVCVPQDGDSGQIGFVKIADSSRAIIHSDAVILQRTSNRRQKRRLIAAPIQQAMVIGGGGFVTENHTIVIVPDPRKKQLLSLEALCRLLNTKAVDARFRRMSGTVSVSTRALCLLPLPAANDVEQLFSERERNDDEATIAAYAASISRARAGEATKVIKMPKRPRHP
jgi:adenine-specific DNA-methyltransferase